MSLLRGGSVPAGQAEQSGLGGRRADKALTQLHEDLVALTEMLRGTKGDSIGALLHDIRWELQQQRKAGELYRAYVTRGVLREVEAFTQECQMTFLETMQTLATTRSSFTRFGDGEFRMMLRPDYRLKFQENSPGLRDALRHTLTLTERSDLLVGFPRLYRDFHWSGVWLDIWLSLEPLLDRSYRYGNSHVSRPVFFQTLGEEGVRLWRQVWQGCGLCVITGEGSRFAPTPELFDSAGELRYVLSTPTNAFIDLERLVDVVGEPVDGELKLVSLGPAGTILSGMLAERGHRVLDVGHISDSYRNVFEGGDWPERLSVTRQK